MSELLDNWYKKAESLKDEYSLFDFIKEVLDSDSLANNTIQQGAICMMAVSNFMSNKYSFSGLSYSCLMWKVIKHMQLGRHQSGMKLLVYDDMLYPQYEKDFEKTISQSTFDSLQKQAKKLIETESQTASEEVVNHWRRLVDGEVPFRYVVSE